MAAFSGEPWRGLSKIVISDSNAFATTAEHVTVSVEDVTPDTVSGHRPSQYWDFISGNTASLRLELVRVVGLLGPPTLSNQFRLSFRIPGTTTQVGSTSGAVSLPASGSASTVAIRFDNDPFTGSTGALAFGMLELYLELLNSGTLVADSRGTNSGSLNSHDWARGYYRSRGKGVSTSLSNKSFGGVTPAHFLSGDPIYARMTVAAPYRSCAATLRIQDPQAGAGVYVRSGSSTSATLNFDASFTGANAVDSSFDQDSDDLVLDLPSTEPFSNGDKEFVWATTGHPTNWAYVSDAQLKAKGRLDVDPSQEAHTGNKPPYARLLDPIAVEYNTAETISLTGEDYESTALTFEIVDQPDHATALTVTNQTGTAGSPNVDTATVSYSPTSGYSGKDSFSFRLNDGSVPTSGFRAASSPTFTTTGATSWAINRPSGTAVGDLMVAALLTDGGALSGTILVPTGWELGKSSSLTSGGDIEVRLYYKVARLGEASSYTWTLPASRSGVGTILAYDNVAVPGNPLAGFTAQAVAPGTSVSTPASTAPTNGVVLAVFATDASATSWTQPSGMSTARALASSTSGSCLGIFDLVQTAGGTVTSKTSTHNGGTGASDGSLGIIGTFTLTNGNYSPSVTVNIDVASPPPAQAPKLAARDRSEPEGSGTRDAYITVDVLDDSDARTETITVDYYTNDGVGTAVEGTDYSSKYGTISIPPGVRIGTGKFTVYGNTSVASDKTLEVKLTNAVNATIVDDTLTFTLTNDDTTGGSAPAFRAASSAGSFSSSVTSQLVSKPSSPSPVENGDLLLAFVNHQADVSITSVPNGWLTLRGDTTATGSGGTITPTVLTQDKSSSDVSSYPTDPITPSANKLILLAVSNGVADTVTNTAISSVTGCGLTWVLVDTIEFVGSSSKHRTSIYHAMGASPTNGAVNIGFAANQGNCAWRVIEFAGVDTSGTNGSGAVVQKRAASGTGTNRSVDLTSAITSGNATFAAGCHNSTSNDWVAGSGFAELGDDALTQPGAPSTRLFCEWSSIGADPATATSGSLNWTMVGLEIKVAGVSSNDAAMSTYYKMAEAEPADYTWGFSAATDCAIGIVAYSGINPSSAIATHAGQPSSVDLATSAAALSVNAQETNSKLICAFATNIGSITTAPQTFTQPAGMTERIERTATSTGITVNAGLAVDDETISAAGPTGSRSSTYTDNGRNIAVSVLLRPGPTAPTNTKPRVFNVTKTVYNDESTAILLKAQDAEQTELTWTAPVAGPSHGSVVVTNQTATAGLPYNEDSISVAYTPTGGYTGTDSFTIKANDGSLDSDIGTVSLTVIARPVTPTISIKNASVLEGSGPHTVTMDVQLSAAASNDVTFTYSTDDTNPNTTATNGDDYEAVTGRAGIITAGNTKTTIPITVTGDNATESDQQVIVKIENISGANSGTTSATLLIRNDDAPVSSPGGCMIGWHDKEQAYNIVNGHQTALGKDIACWRTYHQSNDGFFNPVLDRETKEMANAGKLVLASHKPPLWQNSDEYSIQDPDYRLWPWEYIHQGKADGEIRKLAEEYKKLPAKEIIFIFHHEPHDQAWDVKDHNNQKLLKSRSGDSTDYKLAWKKIWDIFREVGAHHSTGGNVFFGYCAVLSNAVKTADGSTKVGSGDKMYPGDLIVDVLCHDAYNWGDYDGHDDSWETPGQVFSNLVELCQQQGHKKMIIAETACGMQENRHPSDWYRQLGTHIQSTPDLKKYFIGFCLYSTKHTNESTGNTQDWRILNEKSEPIEIHGFSGFKDAFCTGQASSWFVGKPFSLKGGVVTENGLSVTDVTVTRGTNTKAEFLITLDPEATSTTTVAYSTQNGAAMAGTDYVAKSGTATFNVGATSFSVLVDLISGTVTTDKSFYLKLSNPSGAAIRDDTGTCTIKPASTGGGGGGGIGTTTTITRRGAELAADGSAPGTLDLTVPTGAESGDLLLVFYTVAANATVSAPGGWISVTDGLSGTADQDNCRQYVWRKAYGGEAGPYTFTNSVAADSAAVIVAYGGVDASAPVRVSQVLTSNSASDTEISAPALSTSLSGDMLIAGFGVNPAAQIDTSFTLPEGMALVEEADPGPSTTNRAVLAVYDQLLTGPSTAKTSVINDDGRNVGISVALKPAAAVGGGTPTISHFGSLASGHYASGVTSFEADVPATAATGDLLLAFVNHQGHVSVTGVPADWGLVGSPASSGTSTSDCALAVYRKSARSTDPGSKAGWTFSDATDCAVAISAYRNVDAASPIDNNGAAYSTAFSNDSADTTILAQQVTTATNNAVLVCGFASNIGTTNAGNGHSQPTGMQERVETVNADTSLTARAGLSICEETRATAGATGTRTADIQGSGNNGANAAISLALKPASTSSSGGSTQTTWGDKWTLASRHQGTPTGVNDPGITIGSVSGLTSSKKYLAGKWAWGLRDSNTTDQIYAITQIGPALWSEPKGFTVKDPNGVVVSNRDWEDMTYSEEGGKTYVWIVDHRSGTDMKILKIEEPDPNQSGSNLTALCVAQWTFNIPDPSPGDSYWVGQHVNNVEAMFYYGGKIHIVMKQQNMNPWVYRLDLPAGGGTATLTKVGGLPDGEGLSVCAISADGKHMLTARSVGKVKVRRGDGTSLLSLMNGTKLWEDDLGEDNIEAGDFYPWGASDFTLIGEEESTRLYKNG